MTNLQAIDLLKGLEQSLDDYCELNDEGKTAFRMAITALELFGNSEQLPSAQETHEERTETHACDLIDRQAAIDVADAVWSVTGDKNVAKVWDQIKDLPSVQPVSKDINVPVKDCISRQWLMECVDEGWIKFDTQEDENRFVHLIMDIAPSAQSTMGQVNDTAQSTNDCISRQDAIDALKMDISIIPFAKAREYVREAIEEIYNRLEELPSAQRDHIAEVSKKVDSDLISRQAAIDAIMCEPTDAHYPSWYAERLEQLPSAQPEQRWIPCGERLPEESG